MRAATCPTHPGIRTDTRPCYKCGPKEAPMDESTITFPPMAEEPTGETVGPYGFPYNPHKSKEAPMTDIKSDVAEQEVVFPLAVVPDDESTVTLDADSPYDPESVALGVADITRAIGQAAADTWRQPVLDDTLFPPVRRADTPMVKVSISGSIELTQEQYQAYLDGARLGPGAVVEIRASGYVVMPGAAWVKRTEGTGEDREVHFEREGRVKIRLVDLGELSPTGEEWSE